MALTTRVILIGLLTGVFTALACAAEPVTLEKPLPVFVTVRNTRTPEKISGNLLSYDDENLTLKTSKEERQLKWTDLTGPSAYAVRSKLIDKKNPTDWLTLGTFAWSLNAREETKYALSQAVKLDKSLKPRADEILASKPGSALAPPAEKDAANEKSQSTDTKTSPNPDSTVVAYGKPTPEQNQAAITHIRDLAATVQRKLSLRFTEIQTDHFIIFTDWDSREYSFLKENLEGAYAAVSKQFNIPVKENIFVGKLPVYMIAQRESFQQFCIRIDNFTDEDAKKVAGYYSGGNGVGHMAMFKPDTSRWPLDQAKIEWAYVLTHEFTHAFVARYRSNRNIPTWLNEGIAEVIASQHFTRPNTAPILTAKYMAQQNSSIQNIFADDTLKSGQWYPVMQTITETLVAGDRKAFLSLVDDIKQGMKPEAALEKNYKSDYVGLEKAWRKYLARCR